MRGHSFVWWFIVICVVAYVISNPAQAAGIVTGAVDGAVSFGSHLITGLSNAGS